MAVMRLISRQPVLDEQFDPGGNAFDFSGADTVVIGDRSRTEPLLCLVTTICSECHFHPKVAKVLRGGSTFLPRPPHPQERNLRTSLRFYWIRPSTGGILMPLYLPTINWPDGVRVDDGVDCGAIVGFTGRESSTMRLEDSMCEVIAKAKEGDEDAVRTIWDRYFPQVVRLAGTRLKGQNRQAADEEDVAASVMESFFRAAEAGRFPNLRDSDGIWRLLSWMTQRKVIDLVRRNAARPAVDALNVKGEANSPVMASLVSADPTPAMIALLNDQIQRLFEVLPEKYHRIALKKLECMTVPEIAQACGVHISTVERRLRIIREFWVKEFDSTK